MQAARPSRCFLFRYSAIPLFRYSALRPDCSMQVHVQFVLLFLKQTDMQKIGWTLVFFCLQYIIVTQIDGNYAGHHITPNQLIISTTSRLSVGSALIYIVVPSSL